LAKAVRRGGLGAIIYNYGEDFVKGPKHSAADDDELAWI